MIAPGQAEIGRGTQLSWTRLNALRRSAKSAILVIVGVSWAVAVAAGLVVLSDYDTGPAPPGNPPARWPTASHLPAPKARARLVMAVHPQCPCTRASLGELERLMARSTGLVDAYLLFYRPDGVPPDWERTGLWTRAAAIPGVQVVRDDRGQEAERFGALASGQAMLYSVNGDLLFRGGITNSRGHAGDNPGSAAIVALVRREPTTRTVTPVFGCTLRDSARPQPRSRGVIAGVRQVLGHVGLPVQSAE